MNNFTAKSFSDNAPPQAGWHFLQIPGPTNIPSRVLRAMAQGAIEYGLGRESHQRRHA